MRIKNPDRLFNLLIAFILVYTGPVFIWNLNPFLAVCYVLAGIYMAIREALHVKSPTIS